MSTRYISFIDLEIELEIEADIDPAEPMAHDYCGHPASASISIMHNGVDITASFKKAQILRLENEVLEEFLEKEQDAKEDAADRRFDTARDDEIERKQTGEVK